MDWKREKVGPIKSFPDAFISIFLFSISIFWFEEISSQMVAVVCLWWAVVTICSVAQYLSIGCVITFLRPMAASSPPPPVHRPVIVSGQSPISSPSGLNPWHQPFLAKFFWKNGEIWPFLKIWSKGSKNGFLLRISTHVSTLDTSPWHPSQKLWNL